MTQIILIMNQKGGVGKSTMAWNLAMVFSLQYKVAIFDADPQGSLAQLSKLNTDFEISNNWRFFKRATEFDIILIDTPPYLSDHLKKLIPAAHLILIPTKIGVVDVMAMSATINLIKSISIKTKMKIILNMVKPNTTLTTDVAKKLVEFKVPVSKIFISDLVDITRSFLIMGVPKNNKARYQFFMLTNLILDELKLQKIKSTYTNR